jgi:hypothetical protein
LASTGTRGQPILVALLLALSAAAALLGVGGYLVGLDDASVASVVAGLTWIALAFFYARAAFTGARPDKTTPRQLRTLAWIAVVCVGVTGAFIAIRFPLRGVAIALVLSAFFGGIPFLAAIGVEGSLRPPAPLADGANGVVAKQRRARWPFLLAFAMLLFAMLSSGNRTDHIGGKWVIVWKRGWFPEAGGGPWPMLHRRRLIGTRQVDELVRQYNYVGDDCVVYVTYYSSRVGLRAACGDHPPIVLSDEKSGIDWLAPHPAFRTDPIQVSESTFVSVAEVKRRAMR